MVEEERLKVEAMGRSAFIIFTAFLVICLVSSCDLETGDKKKSKARTPSAPRAEVRATGDTAGQARCIEDLEKIAEAVSKYYSKLGVPPPDLESIVEEGFLSADAPLEYGGKRYLYMPSGLVVNIDELKDPIVVCIRAPHRRKGRLVALRSGAVRWMREKVAVRTIARQKMEYGKLLRKQSEPGEASRPPDAAVVSEGNPDLAAAGKAFLDSAFQLLDRGDVEGAEKAYREFLKNVVLGETAQKVERFRAALRAVYEKEKKAAEEKIRQREADLAKAANDLEVEREKTARAAELAKKAEEPEKKKEAEAAEEKDKNPYTTRPEFFGVEITSDRVIFIIDISSSMSGTVRWPPAADPRRPNPRRPNPRQPNPRQPRQPRPGRQPQGQYERKIDLAKKELIGAVKKLGKKAMLNIYFFESRFTKWQPKMIKATSKARTAAIKWVEPMQPRGGTNIYDTLEDALKDPKVEAIYLLSDGQPGVGKYIRQEDILREIKKINKRRKVKINTISFGYDSDLMKQLAEQNDGQYVCKK